MVFFGKYNIAFGAVIKIFGIQFLLKHLSTKILDSVTILN